MTTTPPERAEAVLTRSPSLAPLLARGAVLSPFRRPDPAAAHPRTRLVLPGLRPDPAKLAAYAKVCGFPAAADTLPVTYPHVLGFPLAMRLMSARDFPLPLLGLVHTSIGVTRHRATPAAGFYDLSVYVDGLAPHRRGTEAAVVTELRSGDELVWESRSTYLARHRTTGAKEQTRTEEGPERSPSRSGGSPVTWAAATAPRPATATRSTCTRSPRASSASPAPSRTACGPSPAVSPPTASRTRPRSGRTSGRRCCCPAR